MLCKFPPLVLMVCVLVMPRFLKAGEDPEAAAKNTVRLVPVTSFKADVRGLLKLKEHLLQLSGSEDADAVEGTIFELLEMDDRPRVMPDAAQPKYIRFELYNCVPSSGLVFDIVMPGSREDLLATLGEESTDVEERTDGVLMAGEVPCVCSEDYFAVSMVEDLIGVEDSVLRLRKLLRETETCRLQSVFSISSSPRQIGRSLIKPQLAAQRAGMLTQAQRRDSEPDLGYLSRTLQMKSMVGLFEAFFQDTENIEFSLDFSEHSLRSVIELRIKAKKDSALARYISRCNHSRNRAMRWLHPDHKAFAALALPLPKLLKSMLPALTKETLKFLQQESSVPDSPSPAAAALVDQVIERDQLECLIQVVPVPQDGSHAEIFILPLGSASVLESTVIQLVSAVPDVWERSVAEIVGWPVNRLRGQTEFMTTASSDDDGQLYWVMTDQCVAAWIGTEESLEVLERILTHDGEEHATADRYGRTAFAAATNRPYFAGDFRELFDIPDAMVARLKEDGPESLDDNIELAVQTEPQTLSLTATFQPDAAFAAVQIYELGLNYLVMFLAD